MTDKISIIKQAVEAASRKLSVNWTIESEKLPFPLKGVKEMNEEEQADEIVRRLSQPYKTPAEQLEESMMAVLSSEISREIDNEILNEMMKSIYSIGGVMANDKESNT